MTSSRSSTAEQRTPGRNAPPVAVQLYTVRNQLADLDATLGRLAALGVHQVEPFTIFDRTTELATALATYGLSAATGHSPFLSEEIEHQGRRMALPPRSVTFETARALGVELLIDPIVPAERWRSLDDVRRTADRFNEAAQEAAGHELRLGYHNHSFEFHYSLEGVSAYEHFVSLLEPDAVVEVDVFWAATAGQDVPALLHRLGDRVVALHLKDGQIASDPFRQADGYQPERLRQVPLGQGDLQIGAVLAAAPAATRVIEFDHLPGDPFRAIEESLDFLRTTCGRG